MVKLSEYYLDLNVLLSLKDNIFLTRAKKWPGWAGPGQPRLAKAGPNGPARTGPKLTFLKNANAEKC